VTSDIQSSPAQLRLLDLQAADTTLSQLAHRRATLPELAAIAECERRAGELDNLVLDAQTRVGDLSREQRRLEAEVDTVRAREQRDEQRLQAGGLPAKELEGLQHELATLARRQSALEDEVLEAMEALEQAEADLTARTAERDQVGAERGTLSETRDAAFAEIDERTAQVGAERQAIAGELPDELLAVYERARAHGGGIGAAMLRNRRCEGCRIELSGQELSAVRAAAPDAVVRCEECRRILVRTSESGL
jgi:predicted  nucleic acid-binding Zn-ribbon protein